MGYRSGLLICVIFVLPAVIAGDCGDCFTAAVFEHRPRAQSNSTLSPREIVSSNLRFYEKAASLAAKNGADIIVFNEFGLFPYEPSREFLRKYMEHVPDPKKVEFNPCVENDKNRYILHTLSCMARRNKIFVVANAGDIHPCNSVCDISETKSCADKCPEDGVLMYNTDVVFNPEGKLVARYHKMHPYFEVLNVPDEPEYITFDTNFGKFGLIVCFDSVFEEAFILAKEHGIDTLLFPTYWFDDILPLNAIEFQQSWALANGVNFIAANAQTPGLGTLGSGIFSKETGAVVYTYEPDGESKLLIGNIKIKKSSKKPVKSSITVITEDGSYLTTETGKHFPEHCYESKVGPAKDLYRDYRCFKSQTENYTLIKLETSAGKVEACNNEFCCSVKYSANDMQEDFYLAVFNGTNNVKNYYHWCEETCMLIRCDPFDGKACAIQPSVSKTVFKSVKMTARFTSPAVYPTVSRNKFRLACKKEWDYYTEKSGVTLKFESKSDEPLLKVGLMGRCYQRDPPFVPFYKY
ncbi:pantetheinase-like isoform X2 [Stegodyphus dumicola]|uniref:pantetheinase-like isoform X2 n=1 Tax=Stegodyphus dumicola TaxID=202533 RepID=UPI0015ACCE96|nr:pantetheinase-like isoform X2 [Stegodyphus dumicola]